MPDDGQAMSANKQTVERYMEGFRTSDHDAILACLADDVEWVLPGAFHIHGKVAFDGEIESPCFEGSPQIHIARLVEENDVVVAEGTVRTRKVGGEVIDLVFCDVFLMRDGLIRHLTSYLMNET